ncbi:hypothetical protein K144316041_23510 [Clostridium tetani]|uniref:hypothetical protein n=1 Tax=Clostridium tetani TaxID=1513 RepID=UPI002954D963|nr:hypothetical protein [Clostridium tetani]BDR73643.1 hypothetical protein K144316041_23510 [Clostridium tetani]
MKNEYVGLIGSLLGSIVGAIASYKGSTNGIKKQIEHEQIKLNQEKEENKFRATNLIKYYLKEEIKNNFDKLYSNNKKGFQQELEKALDNEGAGYGYIKEFDFEEYNSIKYIYINYINEEIIDLYKMFHMLYNADGLNKLDKKQLEFVKTTYFKYKDNY